MNSHTTYPLLSTALPDIDSDIAGVSDDSSWSLEIGFPDEEAETIFDQISFCTPSILLLSPSDFVIPYILYKASFKFKISKLKFDSVDLAFCPFIF